MIPQKALHLYLDEEKAKPKHIGHTYVIFEKHDGWYGYLDFPSCVIHSGARREIPAVKALSDKIRQARPRCKGRLIFEIMIEGLEIDSFPTLNGILNRKYEDAEDVYLRVHDYIPDFNVDVPFNKRYQFAQEIVRRLDMPEVRMSEILNVSDDPAEWREVCREVWARGGEGIIGKRIDAPYSPKKRNADIIKIKEELMVEMRPKRIIEGIGEHRGIAGKLLCVTSDGREHDIGMGTMTHERRAEILKNPRSLAKVVQVKAMKKLKDGSYREPRFYAERFDKAEKDID